jgi:hypothetical protein
MMAMIGEQLCNPNPLTEEEKEMVGRGVSRILTSRSYETIDSVRGYLTAKATNVWPAKAERVMFGVRLLVDLPFGHPENEQVVEIAVLKSLQWVRRFHAQHTTRSSST